MHGGGGGVVEGREKGRKGRREGEKMERER